MIIVPIKINCIVSSPDILECILKSNPSALLWIYNNAIIRIHGTSSSIFVTRWALIVTADLLHISIYILTRARSLSVLVVKPPSVVHNSIVHYMALLTAVDCTSTRIIFTALNTAGAVYFWERTTTVSYELKLHCISVVTELQIVLSVEGRVP